MKTILDIIDKIKTVYTRKQQNGLAVLISYIVLYSVVRFVLEFFRGDLIRGIYLGLSSYQWVSILLLIISVFGLILMNKINRPVKTDIPEQ